jgi:hypothetical protein
MERGTVKLLKIAMRHIISPTRVWDRGGLRIIGGTLLQRQSQPTMRHPAWVNAITDHEAELPQTIVLWGRRSGGWPIGARLSLRSRRLTGPQEVGGSTTSLSGALPFVPVRGAGEGRSSGCARGLRLSPGGGRGGRNMRHFDVQPWAGSNFNRESWEMLPGALGTLDRDPADVIEGVGRSRQPMATVNGLSGPSGMPSGCAPTTGPSGIDRCDSDPDGTAPSTARPTVRRDLWHGQGVRLRLPPRPSLLRGFREGLAISWRVAGHAGIGRQKPVQRVLLRPGRQRADSNLIDEARTRSSSRPSQRRK